MTETSADRNRFQRIEEKLIDLDAQLGVLQGRIERLEAKAWPFHYWFNRIERWKRGQWWWIDGLLNKMPRIIRMDNTGGKSVERAREHERQRLFRKRERDAYK
jgi:hypothetical protein